MIFLKIFLVQCLAYRIYFVFGCCFYYVRWAILLCGFLGFRLFFIEYSSVICCKQFGVEEVFIVVGFQAVFRSIFFLQLLVEEKLIRCCFVFVGLFVLGFFRFCICRCGRFVCLFAEIIWVRRFLYFDIQSFCCWLLFTCCEEIFFLAGWSCRSGF